MPRCRCSMYKRSSMGMEGMKCDMKLYMHSGVVATVATHAQFISLTPLPRSIPATHVRVHTLIRGHQYQ